MWRVYVREHRQFGPWVQRIDRQPGWITKAAIIAALLAFVLPLALLTLAAVMVGVVIFLTFALIATGLAAVARFWAGLTGRLGADDGRRNVRVIEHRDTDA